MYGSVRFPQNIEKILGMKSSNSKLFRRFWGPNLLNPKYLEDLGDKIFYIPTKYLDLGGEIF